MSTDANLEEKRLRVRKLLAISTENAQFTRGTFVWGIINRVYWPGIVLSPEDAQLNERKNHYILFWFGDWKLSHVPWAGVELFAINFKKYFRKKKGPLWQKAISEAVAHYGYPFTAGMNYDDLVKFAWDNTIENIDLSSHLGDLPEFVKINIYANKLQRKIQLEKSKKFAKIQYNLPHMIDGVCIACLDHFFNDDVPHPLFEMNVCEQCARKLREILYYMEDGTYKYCFICGNLKNFQCKNLVCEATYCSFCIKIYWGHNVATCVNLCILCCSLMAGLLRPRENYILKSCLFMAKVGSSHLGKKFNFNEFQELDIAKAKGILNVLSMFHGTSTGIETAFPRPFNAFLANMCNNQQQRCEQLQGSKDVKRIQKYFNNNFVRIVRMTTYAPIQIDYVPVHTVEIQREKCKAFEQVMVVVGGTNMLKNKLQHFRRKNFVDLFMEFWRVLKLMEEEVNAAIKWLFEMPFTLDMEEIDCATRFLGCQPNIICDSNQKHCFVWTNISIAQK